MNKVILVIVIILVVGGVYFLFRTPSVESPVNPGISGQGEASFTTPPAPATALVSYISYTASGYLPAELRISRGQTVTFRNLGGGEMWTASARHPTHAVYPTTGGCLGSTFDSCRGVPAGGDWSFKFDVLGTWQYHNHLSPSHFGTIIVE